MRSKISIRSKDVIPAAAINWLAITHWIMRGAQDDGAALNMTSSKPMPLGSAGLGFSHWSGVGLERPELTYAQQLRMESGGDGSTP